MFQKKSKKKITTYHSIFLYFNQQYDFFKIFMDMFMCVCCVPLGLGAMMEEGVEPGPHATGRVGAAGLGVDEAVTSSPPT
jgi:hypothetical protein